MELMSFGLSPYKRAAEVIPKSDRLLHLIGTVPSLLLEARRKNTPRQPTEGIVSLPSVSVVICAYNEERNIGALLSTLLKERVREIIVVASGCTDRTAEIAREFQAAYRRIKVLIEDVRNGKTSAINLALKHVTSEFVIFLPADVRPTEGGVARLIEGFRPEVGIRVGRPVPVDETSNTMGRLSHLIWMLHNRTLRELSIEGSLGHASGEFFAIRRGILKELPVDVVNDDAFMAVAARAEGFKIEYEDTALAFMRGPGTVFDYVNQRRRVLFGHLQVMKSTGRYPTVFETQAVVHPSLFLQILRAELKGLRGGLRAFIMGATLEAISFTLSAIDRTMGRSHVLWQMVESTKNMPGSLPIPLVNVSGLGGLSFSTHDAYLGQSPGRSWRSGLTRGRLSLQPEVAVLPMCR